MKKDVFISYHEESSLYIVKDIVKELEAKGISCWYAPRDVCSNFMSEIVEAIGKCKVFLLIVNRQSIISEHVLSEIKCAFDRCTNHEEIVILPYRVEKCELKDSSDAYYLLNRKHIRDGVTPPRNIRIQELVACISSLLERGIEKRMNASESFSVYNLSDENSKGMYRIVSSIVYPNSQFVGRKQELETLHRQITGDINKVFLVGIGGIGKSEIAKKYVSQYISEYDVVLWVSFSESIEKTLINDHAVPIDGFCRTNYIADNDRSYFERKLQVLKNMADRRMLIVIDNFDILDDPDLFLFCSGSYSIIFTTRYHQGGNIPEMEIGEIINEEELLLLFQMNYQRMKKKHSTDIIKQIIYYLNAHTQSIGLVASVMQSHRISPKKMLKILKKGMTKVSKGNGEVTDLIMEQLHKLFKMSKLNKDEEYLLKNMSLLFLHEISIEMLYDWCEMDDFDIIDGLIRKNWIIYNPVTDEVHLHPLIAELSAEKLNDDRNACNLFILHLEKACRPHDTCRISEKLRLFEYTNMICKRIPKEHPLQKVALKARANMLFLMSFYEESALIYKNLLDQEKDIEEQVYICNKLCQAYILDEEIQNGIDVALKCFKHISTLDYNNLTERTGHYYNGLMSRLCEAYRLKEDFDKAIYYGRLALKTCDDYLFDTSITEKRGWIEFHLAYVLLKKGEVYEAELLISDAIKLFEQVDNKMGSGHSREVLSQVMLQKGDYEKALMMNKQAYHIIEGLYQDSHQVMAQNYIMRANIYKVMGDKENAKIYYQYAIVIFDKMNAYKQGDKVRAILEDMKKN